VGGVAIPRKNERPVRNGVTLYKGGMVAADSAGNYVPAGNANAATACQGVLMEVDAVNETVTGNAAGTELARLTVGIFWFDNSAGVSAVTAANLGQVCYAVDDETVSLDDANGTLLPAGVVTNVDATLGVAVSIIPQIPLGSAAVGGMVKRVADTITSADLTTAGVGPETENVGSPIPATAIVLAARAKLDDAFDNGAGVSLVMELGHDGDADAYEDGFDCFTGSAHEAGEWQYETPGPALGTPPALATAGTRQMTATFTAGADQLANFTDGEVHVEFLYLDVPSVL
jgi:hypothetical protein